MFQLFVSILFTRFYTKKHLTVNYKLQYFLRKKMSKYRSCLINNNIYEIILIMNWKYLRINVSWLIYMTLSLYCKIELQCFCVLSCVLTFVPEIDVILICSRSFSKHQNIFYRNLLSLLVAYLCKFSVNYKN